MTIPLIALPFPFMSEAYTLGNTPVYNLTVVSGWTVLDPFNRLVMSKWTETELLPYQIKHSLLK